MNTSQELKRLINLVEHKMTHEYTSLYVTPPKVDAAKARAVYSVLLDADLLPEMAEEYFTAVMLIQAALDMHDSVGDKREDARKGRQLSVLAGDYYSSMYYLILSQCEDIELIKMLSRAIQHINETKMSLHLKDVSDPYDYIEAVRKKESLLVTETAGRFGKEQFVSFLEDYLFLAVSKNDRSQLELLAGSENVRSAVNEAYDRMRKEDCMMPSMFSRDNRELDLEYDGSSMTGEG
ncbi:heptaprenyl diphosphate synthase component 1 [Fictibacillus iocasae]|uniref:Heptaprenyl diphosphate synthase component 1 n=1 Tax=Fictibacillus iocasae TaxID=2715437 RepID=A0ABW2NMU3_9BACL